MSAQQDEVAAQAAILESAEAVVEAQEFYRNMVSMYVDSLIDKEYVISKHDLEVYAEAVSEGLYAPLSGRITYTGWKAGDDYATTPNDNDLFLEDEHERLVSGMSWNQLRRQPADDEAQAIAQLEAAARTHLGANPTDTLGAIKAICDERVAIATGNGACQTINHIRKEGAK